jgi:hypothetical protein
MFLKLRLDANSTVILDPDIVVNNARLIDMSAQRDKFINRLGHRGCREEARRLPLPIVFLVEINLGVKSSILTSCVPAGGGKTEGLQENDSKLLSLAYTNTVLAPPGRKGMDE